MYWCAMRWIILASVAPFASAGSPRYRNPTVRPAWYKARQRSMTPAQKRAERALWPKYGLTFRHGAPLDFDAAFGRSAPRVLEVGCGCGEALTVLAAARPDCDFVGVDWLRRGLASCLVTLEDHNLTNVRLVRADAATLLEQALPRQPLFDEALFFFPDPWRGSPERRLLRADVVEALSCVMRPSGSLRVGTDVPGYPESIRQVLADAEGWHPISCQEIEESRPGHSRPSTRYEREAIAEGRPIADLCYIFDPEPSTLTDGVMQPARVASPWWASEMNQALHSTASGSLLAFLLVDLGVVCHGPASIARSLAACNLIAECRRAQPGRFPRLIRCTRACHLAGVRRLAVPPGLSRAS